MREFIGKLATVTRPSSRKLYLGVDPDSGQIVAAAMTSKKVHEAHPGWSVVRADFPPAGLDQS
jgi:hypothetical protein